MYLQTVIATFAFTDDYPLLGMATGLGPSPWFGQNVLDAYAVNGRPVAGLLKTVLFSAAGTIDNLRYVRLVAVLGIVLLAMLLHWALVRARLRSPVAALLAVLVCSMPAFQVDSSWATLATSPYAAALGGIASLRVAAAVDGPRRLVVGRLIGGAAALIVGLLVYQPAAMFFWVFLAVALVGAASDPPRARRLIRGHLAVAVVALPVGYLAVKLGAHFIGNNTPNAARNALTTDVVGKARWFFDQALYQSLNLFELVPNVWLATIFGAVAAGGLLLLIRRRAACPGLSVLAAVCLVPLTALPNLVTDENVAWYRTQISITSLLALYAGLGALGIWFEARDLLLRRADEGTVVAGERLVFGLGVVVVVTSVFFAARNVHSYFVRPQEQELQLVRGAVKALPTGLSRVAFVRTDWTGGVTKIVRYDEFGLPSTGVVWTSSRPSSSSSATKDVCPPGLGRWSTCSRRTRRPRRSPSR